MPGPQVEALINLISPVKREFSNNLNPLRVMSSIVPRMVSAANPNNGFIETTLRSYSRDPNSMTLETWRVSRAIFRCKTRVTEKNSVPFPTTLWSGEMISKNSRTGWWSSLPAYENVPTLIDSGSSDCFINDTFMKKLALKTYQIKPLELHLFDGSTNSIITHAIDIPSASLPETSPP
ncbi:uncharacterized protein EI90DRAFT_3115518 [Cantharellus anzutake]|uniref:uncharacterized protein n=1 Tax=Cantharellus anzutake TaxID=1750568 RepID=UPI0019075239|nr:uncharacterized protein EI90DRAFT_3115518 [Cantharellus anzutake]KAF8343020.1 hypothetical protein EI90DRAFT_3115518 [Cantharellus anzutake]